MPVFHGRNAEIFGAPKNRYGIDSAVGSHPPSVPDDQEIPQGPAAPELIDDDGNLDGRQDVVKVAREGEEQHGEAPQKASQTNRTATPTNEQASKWASAPPGPGDHTDDGFFVAEDGGIKRPLVVVTFGDGVRSEEQDETVIPMSVKEAASQRPRRHGAATTGR
eukprot:g5774.t1